MRDACCSSRCDGGTTFISTYPSYALVLRIKSKQAKQISSKSNCRSRSAGTHRKPAARDGRTTDIDCRSNSAVSHRGGGWNLPSWGVGGAGGGGGDGCFFLLVVVVVLFPDYLLHTLTTERRLGNLLGFGLFVSGGLLYWFEQECQFRDRCLVSTLAPIAVSS